MKKIPGVARGCLDTIPGFFHFSHNSLRHEAFIKKKNVLLVKKALLASPTHHHTPRATSWTHQHRYSSSCTAEHHTTVMKTTGRCEGAGSFFDCAMLQSALLAACEKLLDQSMPLMFREIVSGQLLASRS